MSETKVGIPAPGKPKTKHGFFMTLIGITVVVIMAAAYLGFSGHLVTLAWEFGWGLLN